MGRSCLLTPLVMGYKRVPAPPAKTMPFICLSFVFLQFAVDVALQYAFHVVNYRVAVFEGIKVDLVKLDVILMCVHCEEIIARKGAKCAKVLAINYLQFCVLHLLLNQH